ncbi:ATP-binding response regulator [Leptospira saintgironsiae]|uniref:histidine kinase n=1 Tax=Leptospira saintgironsiae TaxID=2023183 RepID=A0A2M9Y852_9LEPT|nr:hybrid sensor histidine kinase/response regulator [Leptospira saintgironsiae]PJZ47734.1 hybrid sensor histidine kinase/response regulator [Leptospira saintgironsiae]
MLILVVDDSYQNRKLISAQLENGSRKIYTASNGLEALEILENTEVDLIISDILMPQMDGYQFCSQVRQNDKFKHIPIIIYTATYTSDSDEKLSFDLGADAFLKKPAGLKLLDETVTKLLQNPRSKRTVKGLVLDSAPLRQYNHRLVEKLEEKNFELQRRSEELGYEIEERIRAERLNREGEELFKELTDAIHEVFWMTSLSKNEIVYISQGYEQIWGRSRQSLLENPISWMECIHPDDRDRVMSNARTRQVTGEYREEYRIVRPDGEIRWIRDKAFPVKNEKGDTIRVAGVAEDITEHKLKEAQLKEVEKKRAELEEQLIQAQKLESLGTLASGIAHDFNNILSIIMGHTSVIEINRNNPEKFSQHITALHMATQRGASLVKQLLTFARKTEFNLEPAQINDIILEVSKLVSQTFPKSIRLLTDFQENLPLVQVDTNQIHQVLLNLCVNARDAMQDGGLLTIETFLTDSENLKKGYSKSLAEKYIILRISDSGSGMSEKTKQRIFEPFFTTKDIGKGTVLGLALAYSVIDNHKGWIEVDSELGKGTSFFLYLPVTKEKSELNIKPNYSQSESLGGNESILVIEDEELLRNMLADLLGSKGYKVHLAVDGEDGVEQFLLKHSEIQLVLTDLGLPKFGGGEVIKRIRAIHNSVKILLASGFMEPELKLSLKDFGVSYFIQKPYLGTEILSCIRSALDQK